ncbi:peroxiredoxin [Candidatus Bathyarchaeota archaeon RBG_16_57_9]|nr:MAG: peroxiredoxin [Candidatus Bathyarchaeota archaeon RBG_16_57_9]
MVNIKLGDEAPDFTLPDQDGGQVTLSNFRGRSSVVLYFYPKDFSLGCTTQACGFRDSYEDFTDLGAVVIGVSGDTVESHKKFIEDYLLPFTLLSDQDGKVRKLYGTTKGFGLLPGRYTLVIDKVGVVRHVFTSETNMGKHVEEAVRILRDMEG